MSKRNFFTYIFGVMLIMCTLLFSITAQAADISAPENLSVDAVWLEGDMINISVTDKQTGVKQKISLPLDEYANNSEYVSVQAVDRNGNLSNTIQFKNPFYVPPTEPTQTPGKSESAIPDGSKPFTPDGTGSVVDNVTDGDGKEFFSIATEDGNVFYLIVDRQRDTDNVYLLNAVSEQDLMSLAKPGDGSVSAIPAQPPTTGATTPPNSTETPQPEQPAAPTANNGVMNNGTIIFIVIAVVAVGGIGYYFKILRPKKSAGSMADDGADDYEDEDDDSDYEDEDYGDPGEDGGRK